MRSSFLTAPFCHLVSRRLRSWTAAAALGMVAGVASLPAQAELTVWRERAQGGDAEALNSLGNAYALGQGVPRDDGEALRHYEEAAALDHAPACFNLGLIYELGRGVPRNEAEAARWYQRAASQKHPRAAYQLAVMLEDGRGLARDEEGAARNYRIAAEQGLGVAQASLGLMLAAGRGGLTPNLPEAYAWLSLAVENGGAPASRDLVRGRMSESDRHEGERVLADLRARVAAAVPIVPVTPATDSAADPAPVTVAAIPAATVGISLGAMDTERADLRASVAQLTTENRELSAALSTAEREVRRLEQTLAAPAPTEAPVPPAPEDVPAGAPSPSSGELVAAQARVDELTEMLANRTRERDEALSVGHAVVPVSDAGSSAQWTERLAEANRTTAAHLATVAELTGVNADLNREIGDLRAQVTALSSAVQILRGDNARLAAKVGVEPATGAAPIVRLPPPPPVVIAGRALPTRPGAHIPVAFTPPPPPPTARLHTVVPGDSLSGISLRYYGTARRWSEIFEANRDSLRAAHLIRPGQRLRIP